MKAIYVIALAILSVMYAATGIAVVSTGYELITLADTNSAKGFFGFIAGVLAGACGYTALDVGSEAIRIARKK